MKYASGVPKHVASLNMWIKQVVLDWTLYVQFLYSLKLWIKYNVKRSTINLWQQYGWNYGIYITFYIIKTLYHALAPSPFTGRQRHFLMWMFNVVLVSLDCVD
jgi:hypothetical protein